ncbi:cytochrome c oxidase subunit 3 [Rhodopseudomonas sp.]|uniref:cytochrome c oxidase subunit 3 n=1 Tax=Rhodopseudomonas sp. TaxID=1078 RepID=UPI003B3A6BB9
MSSCPTATVSDVPSAISEASVLDTLPGYPMIWLLIFSELAAFGALLAAFSVAKALDPATFAAGQAQLDPLIAAVNTFCLVTSGWCAARACAAAHADARAAARRWLAGASLLGGLFIVLKLTEYADEIGRGIDVETSAFFTLYFLLTGFHLLHVVLGLVILGVVAWRAEPANVETGAAFWHMVDLVWLMLVPIIYLMR